MGVDVGTLRELFRHIQAFRSAYESHGIEIVTDPDGIEWSLWDLTYLYEHGLPTLPQRQRQAIELCLVQNRKEAEAAVMMGVSPTNPVAMYATSGLTRLVTMIRAGSLPCFRDAVCVVHREVG